MDFTDGPLATTANLHRLHAQVVQVPGHQCYPAGTGVGVGAILRGPRPLQHPQETAWGRGWDTAVWPWFQQEAWKKKKMRSLRSGSVGCDTGAGCMEEQGAIVTLQSRGKASCGDGHSPPAHARHLRG